MLIPTRKNTSNGRLAPNPSEFESASASVEGALARGVAVAPRTPPAPLDEAPGVPDEDGAALGDELAPALGAELGGVLGAELGAELGGVLGLADGGGLCEAQDGTILSGITNPSENVIR